MQKSIFLIGLVSILFLMASCDTERVEPSGNVTTESFSETGYTKLDLSSAFDAFVTFSDTEESIKIEADDNLHEFIKVEKNGNTLNIGFKNNVSIRGNDATLNVFISTEELEAFDVSGASSVSLQNPLNTNKLAIDLSGASEFEGEVNVNSLTADLSGASDMDLTGSSQTVDIETSGASDFKDYNFVTDELIADMSGASNIKMTVEKTLEVEASGASSLRFKGEATIERQDLSGASTVTRE